MRRSTDDLRNFRPHLGVTYLKDFCLYRLRKSKEGSRMVRKEIILERKKAFEQKAEADVS